MTNWEYVWHHSNDNDDSGMVTLGDLGAEGWEVIHVSDHHESDYTSYFLRREIPDPKLVPMQMPEKEEPENSPLTEIDKWIDNLQALGYADDAPFSIGTDWSTVFLTTFGAFKEQWYKYKIY